MPIKLSLPLKTMFETKIDMYDSKAPASEYRREETLPKSKEEIRSAKSSEQITHFQRSVDGFQFFLRLVSLHFHNMISLFGFLFFLILFKIYK